jgi:hypothetical protein
MYAHVVTNLMTTELREWWEEVFDKNGLPWTDEHSFEFADFCRGVGNGYYDENFSLKSDSGFHFVARKA